MKRLILFIAVIVGLLSASAASHAEGSGDKSHLGLRVSFDLSTSTTYTSVIHWGPGASAGVCYYAPFGRMTYFNAGVLLNYATMKVDGSFKNKPLSRYNGHISTMGLRLPIDIGLKFYQTEKVKLSVYTGPTLFFNFSVKGKYDLIRGGGDLKIDDKISNPGMVIGWGLGLAADISRNWHVHFEGTYGLSHFGESEELREIGNHSMFKRSDLSIGIGYNF